VVVGLQVYGKLIQAQLAVLVVGVLVVVTYKA